MRSHCLWRHCILFLARSNNKNVLRNLWQFFFSFRKIQTFIWSLSLWITKSKANDSSVQLLSIIIHKAILQSECDSYFILKYTKPYKFLKYMQVHRTIRIVSWVQYLFQKVINLNCFDLSLLILSWLCEEHVICQALWQWWELPWRLIQR